MAFLNIKKLITLEHFISIEENKHRGASGEFTFLLHDLTLAMRIIAREVRRAGLNDILGMTNSVNVHGEQVKKLDEYSNEVIIKAMERGGHLCIMASEENDELIKISDQYEKGKYILVYDPLDGSSNIDINATIGTIWGLYKRNDHTATGDGTEEDVLQAGYNQVASGYTLYGSSTVLVYTTGSGVNMFTYDPTLGEFVLNNENVQIPKRGKYYSTNEGNYNLYSDNLKQYIDSLKTSSDDGTKPYSMRYIGTCVADVHRTLLYGGIFMYPEDSKHPNGKLRLVYEANPLSFIIEQAGGKAIDGKERILDIKPTDIHQRVPLYIGSVDDVNELQSYLEKDNKSKKAKK